MSMILEQAGGAGSTGKGRILDIQPTEIHQRTPVFLGSIENVYELDQFFQYCKSIFALSFPFCPVEFPKARCPF